MERYAAVVTTGIYCRPGCTAQPLPANVRSYTVPAAAEADGYRACLRCRPYRLPQIGIWSAGSELVCRAVGMILDGALDNGTEVELGRRLGVSPRHLRRLFRQYLGVTPDGLARSARAHFARRLLDDTDLSVLDIAYASGFGSVRQLNRACRAIFQMAPRELRARRRRADRLVADGGLVLRLPYSGQLDWQALLDYFSARAIPGVENVADGAYRRTIVVEGHPGVLEIFRDAGGELLMRAHLPRWRELVHLVQRTRRIAGLDLDLDVAERQLRADPVVGPLIQRRPGVRVPGTWDAFEVSVRAILGQQVTIAAANRLAGRLVGRTGTPVSGLGSLGLTHTFPSAEVVAEAELHGIGLTSARARAVRAFAEAVASGEIRLDGSVPLDRLIASITALNGLGPWTAQYIALRIGEPDACPITDLAIRRALDGRTGARTSIEEVVERWRPWRALAITHLWLAAGHASVSPVRAA